MGMSRWIPITDQDPLRLADDLDDLYRDYAATARDTSDAVAQIRRATHVDEWESEAAQAYRDTANELWQRLEPVSEAMAHAALAVDDFHSEVQKLQTAAERIVQQAREAQDNQHRAHQELQDIKREPVGDEPGALTAKEDRIINKRRARENYENQYEQYKKEFWRLVNHAEEEAERATGRLRRATEAAPPLGFWDNHITRRINKAREWCHDQSWWDGLVKNAPTIRNAATGIGIACVAALAFFALPFVAVGTGVIMVVTALGAVAGAVALLCSSAKAFDGSGSWADVGIDSVGLLTFGAAGALGRSASFSINGHLAHNTNRLAAKLPQKLGRALDKHDAAKYGNGIFGNTPRDMPLSGMGNFGKRSLRNSWYGTSEAADAAVIRKSVRNFRKSPGYDSWRAANPQMAKNTEKHYKQLNRSLRGLQASNVASASADGYGGYRNVRRNSENENLQSNSSKLLHGNEAAALKFASIGLGIPLGGGWKWKG